jgi:hypothetical protein
MQFSPAGILCPTLLLVITMEIFGEEYTLWNYPDVSLLVLFPLPSFFRILFSECSLHDYPLGRETGVGKLISSLSARQEVLRLVCNPKFHYCARKMVLMMIPFHHQEFDICDAVWKPGILTFCFFITVVYSEIFGTRMRRSLVAAWL